MQIHMTPMRMAIKFKRFIYRSTLSTEEMGNGQICSILYLHDMKGSVSIKYFYQFNILKKKYLNIIILQYQTLTR